MSIRLPVFTSLFRVLRRISRRDFLQLSTVATLQLISAATALLIPTVLVSAFILTFRLVLPK
ncbi:MAG: twin-arginine translocation signal domain-containing protein [Bacteroidales bacterium]|nr:twin-arginine translocation signal domain-containing protein [Bacteroidales bacterium]